MNILRLLLISVIFIQCNNRPKNDTVEMPVIPDYVKENMAPDTVVGKKDVTTVIPGSEYIRKAYSYAVIVGKDTSLFKCHFSQWKADSTLFFVTKFHKSKSYRVHMAELKRILAEAQKDFDLATIKTIGLGQLAETGDLAIKITREYEAKYGSPKTIIAGFDDFLLQSSLAIDFNALLKPYGLEIKQIVTEKKNIISHKEIGFWSVFENKDFPTRVINCMTYLKAGRVNS